MRITNVWKRWLPHDKVVSPEGKIGSAKDQVNSITVTRAELNELYAQAYNSGHEDTVEGNYTNILPVDYSTYFDEEVADWLMDQGH